MIERKRACAYCLKEIGFGDDHGHDIDACAQRKADKEAAREAARQKQQAEAEATRRACMTELREGKHKASRCPVCEAAATRVQIATTGWESVGNVTDVEYACGSELDIDRPSLYVDTQCLANIGIIP